MASDKRRCARFWIAVDLVAKFKVILGNRGAVAPSGVAKGIFDGELWQFQHAAAIIFCRFAVDDNLGALFQLGRIAIGHRPYHLA